MALDWIPFLIFVGPLIYFMRKMKAGVGPAVRHQELTQQYQSDHLAETRKISAQLERIATALEKRSATM